MSAKAMGKIWDLDLPHAELLVLLAMADHADHDGGSIFPSVGLVAWKTGYSPRQIQRIIVRLEQIGVLVPTEERAGQTTVYRLNIAAGKQKTDYKPTSKCRTYPRQNVVPTPDKTAQPTHDILSDTPDILTHNVCQNVVPTPDILTRGTIGTRAEPSVNRHVEPSIEPNTPKPPTPGGGPELSAPSGRVNVSESHSSTKKVDPDSPGKALLTAFRETRYPGKPPFSETDWQEYKTPLRAAATGGATPEQMRQAAAAAMRRFSENGMVNPRSVIRHWDSLLEPDPIAACPSRDSPNGSPPARRQTAHEEATARNLAGNHEFVEALKNNDIESVLGPSDLAARSLLAQDAARQTRHRRP